MLESQQLGMDSPFARGGPLARPWSAGPPPFAAWYEAAGGNEHAPFLRFQRGPAARVGETCA